MDYVKTALFSRTLQALQSYREAEDVAKTCANSGREWIALRNMRAIRYERFSVLFQVIEDAGLQEEYRLWREDQEAEDG